MQHDAAWFQGNRSSKIEGIACPCVPGSFEYRHVASIWMPVRNIHYVGRESDANHIDAGFHGIAEQGRLLDAAPSWDLLPMYFGRCDSDESRGLFRSTAHGSNDCSEHQAEGETANGLCFHASPCRYMTVATSWNSTLQSMPPADPCSASGALIQCPRGMNTGWTRTARIATIRGMPSQFHIERLSDE